MASTEAEQDSMIDNLWYENRDESTKDEKTQEPKFLKELQALFEKTEAIIKQDRTYAISVPDGRASDRRPSEYSVSNPDAVGGTHTTDPARV